MMVVITGVDKVGKSTLARKICDLVGEEPLHFSKPPVKAHKYFHKAIEQHGKTDSLLVVDRWCEGDEIYAKGMKHERRLTDAEYDNLLKAAQSEGLLYIFCWDFVPAIRRRFKHDGEKFVPPSRIEKIQNLFIEEAYRLAKHKDYTFPVLLVNNFLNTVEVLSYGVTSNGRAILPRTVSGFAKAYLGIRPTKRTKGNANKGTSRRAVSGRGRK